MTSSVEVIPDPGFPAERSADVLPFLDADVDAAAIGRLINERRARSENPEALRLARAL